MKKKKSAIFKTLVLATGVLLGRGAQAGTLLTFDGTGTNIPIPGSFGDNVTANSTGISTNGVGTNGTPDIDASWAATPGTHGGSVLWEFYNGGPWAAAQLNDCATNSVYDLILTPANGAKVVVSSFNFAPYYATSSRPYDFDVKVMSGATVLASQSVHLAAASNAKVPVSINYTGAVSQAITLRLVRTDDQDLLAGPCACGSGEGSLANHGSAWGIAVDDISSAEIPGAPTPPSSIHTYSDLVLNDGPLAFFRFSETNAATVDVATNKSGLGSFGDGFHMPGVQHPVPGALAGNTNTAAGYSSLVAPDIDGGAPTVVRWPEKPLVRELWDNAGIGVLENMGNGTTSLGFDPNTNWHVNLGTMIRVAQDFDIGSAPDNIPGPPVNRGQIGAIWTDSANLGGLAHPWDRRSWATRQLAGAAQINFAANGEYWFTVRIDNTGDTAMGIGFASGNSDSAQFVGVGAMWDNATGPDSGSANNSLYITDGTLGQSDGPYAIRAYTASETINGPGIIVGRIVTTSGGVATVSAAVFQSLGAFPFDAANMEFYWQLTYNFTNTMTATHLLLWANGAGTGDIDAIRVARSYDEMFHGTANPSGSFSVEAWLKPTQQGQPNAQCPLYNRASTGFDGTGNRFGWDLFQRDSSTGWNFRMYGALGDFKVFDVTGGPYTINTWNHLVAVYDSSIPMISLYLNGQLATSTFSSGGSYVPNQHGQLGIGGFANAAENGSGFENPFVGSIDEVAIYTNALSSAQVLAHYQNGTNAARSTPYESLVLSDSPQEYFRLDEPARNVAQNIGTLGSAANGTYASTANGVAGPRPPAFTGFESTNPAVNFNGSSSYVELGNPPALNFTGQITLEAWVKPSAAITSYAADVIAHGVNAGDNAEVMLRLTDVPSGVGNAYYQVGSWDGASSSGTSVLIPAADLSGANWVHLAGTYDGTNWNLYRNGILTSTNAGSFGSILVTNANWAIGARGRWLSFNGTPDRRFNGAIDEPAIYNRALSPTEILAHYYVGVFNRPALTITPSGSDVIITWPAGTLQQADNAAGPYTDLSSATSPYTVAASAKKFYRVRL